MVEALVVSNSRLCAKLVAEDAREFAELDRAMEGVQLTEFKEESKATASVESVR